METRDFTRAYARRECHKAPKSGTRERESDEYRTANLKVAGRMRMVTPDLLEKIRKEMEAVHLAKK
jgi:hypothetical protein